MSQPPNYEFQEWWNKQREKNHDLFEDKPDEPITLFLIINISDNRSLGKERSRSARQLSWVCLLRFQQITSFLASISNGFVFLVRNANRRIASPHSRANLASLRLYRIIKVFFIVVLLFLGFELVAYFKGWHFSSPLDKRNVGR